MNSSVRKRYGVDVSFRVAVLWNCYFRTEKTCWFEDDDLVNKRY